MRSTLSRAGCQETVGVGWQRVVALSGVSCCAHPGGGAGLALALESREAKLEVEEYLVHRVGGDTRRRPIRYPFVEAHHPYPRRSVRFGPLPALPYGAGVRDVE